MGATNGKGSKYGAMPTRIDGHRFDSKKKGIRYVLLKDMANKGEIEELELQPRFAIEMVLLRFSGELIAHSRPAISKWTGLW